jgi:hypothetical protein
MSTKFVPLEIPPGVVALPTKQMKSSNWAEVNLCRWVEGQLSPVGGQAQYTDMVDGVENYQFASRCKAIHGWYGLDGVYRIAYLCEANLYVDVGGELSDISPGSDATDVNYSDGDYSVGLYSGSITQPIQPPLIGAGGYSDGLYSASTYGTPRAESSVVQMDQIPDVYSLDNFGGILYAMTSADGRLLMWDPAVGGAAVVQPADSGRGQVPFGRCFVVTNERFIMIFGSTNDGTTDGGSPRRFAWCDQENPGAWDYSNVTSQAGYLDVEPASPIICAHVTPQGILMWTAKTAYINTFLGIPYVYNYQEIGKNCTPWSPQSIASTASMTLWFSQQGLYSYNGAWIQPMPCKVRPWIDDDIDILNVRWQACAVHVAPFNEFWWFFPQGPTNNPSGYNTRCVIYNYKEGWWSMGQMPRSAGITASYTAHTIMADGTVAYEHEASNTYPADVPLPWAETFDLNLASGSRLVTVKQIIPDIEGDVNNLLYSLFYKNSRSVMPDPATGLPVLVREQQTTPRPVNTSNGFVDLRTTGRDIRLRIALAGPYVNPVTVGQHLIDSTLRGDR